LKTPPSKGVLATATDIVGANPATEPESHPPLQASYRLTDKALGVGDWFQHIGACADDLSVVRSLWTIQQ